MENVENKTTNIIDNTETNKTELLRQINLITQFGRC